MDGSPKDVTDEYQRLVFDEKGEGVVANKREQKKQHTFKRSVVEEEREEYFMPGFKSEKSFENNFDVEISNIEIRDAHNRLVNILKTGNKYTYKYTVKFLKKYKDVSFGMHIKTIKGFGLASSALHNNKELLESVSANDTYTVEWDFTCNLLENVYLTNAGVYINNGATFARVVDAYMFRVESKGRYKIGFVDLQQSISYSKVTENVQ